MEAKSRKSQYLPRPAWSPKEEEDKDKDKHIAVKFFLFYEYAHPTFKHKNPYKKEFLEFFNAFCGEEKERPKVFFQLFQRHKKSYDKPIKPEWLPNRPNNITIESLQEFL